MRRVVSDPCPIEVTAEFLIGARPEQDLPLPAPVMDTPQVAAEVTPPIAARNGNSHRHGATKPASPQRSLFADDDDIPTIQAASPPAVMNAPFPPIQAPGLSSLSVA